MPNTAWDRTRTAQRQLLRAAVDADPKLRTNKQALSAATGVPVNRVAHFLAHLQDPVDTLKNVHRRTGLDRKTVKAHAETAGLQLVDLRMVPIDDDLVARLYTVDGLSLRQVAARTGYSVGGISHALKRAGVPTRRPTP